MRGLVAATWMVLLSCGGGGSPDAGSPDAGSPDAGTSDAGAVDAGTRDAGAPDAGSGEDGGMNGDAGPMDAGPAGDGGSDTDAGGDDAGPPLPDAGPRRRFDPTVLSTDPICPCFDVCWSHPIPSGEELLAAWGVDGCFWTGGAGGTLQYWDGERFRTAPDAPQDVIALAGVDGLEAYAALDRGGVMRWDGEAWTTIASPDIGDVTSLAVVGPSDVWAAGALRQISRWDGAGWTAAPRRATGDARAIFASSARELWAVGDGFVDHLIDEEWTRESGSVPQFEFRDVWAAAPDDVYVAGGSEMRLYHWDGARLSALATTGEAGQPDLVEGTGPDDIWAIDVTRDLVAHFDGVRWTGSSLPEPFETNALVVPSPGEAWVVGRDGRRLRWSGAAWEQIGSVTLAGAEFMWGSGDDDVWASTTDVGPQHFDGTRWTVRDVGMGRIAFRGLWGFGPDDVWTVSGIGGYHWDGRGWTHHRLLASLSSIWGAASDDVWFVGGGGGMAHWDGAALTELVPSPTRDTLNAVWGFAEDDVWAVGAGGTILRYDGSTWSEMTSPTTELLMSVWGAAPDDVWIGGRNGVLYRWDGREMTDASIGRPIGVHRIHGTAADDVWFGLLVRPTTFLHWDGAEMTMQSCGASSATGGLWTGPGGRWLGTLAGPLRAE